MQRLDTLTGSGRFITPAGNDCTVDYHLDIWQLANGFKKATGRLWNLDMAIAFEAFGVGSHSRLEMQNGTAVSVSVTGISGTDHIKIRVAGAVPGY